MPIGISVCRIFAILAFVLFAACSGEPEASGSISSASSVSSVGNASNGGNSSVSNLSGMSSSGDSSSASGDSSSMPAESGSSSVGSADSVMSASSSVFAPPGVIELTVNIWADGNLAAGGEQWFRFAATANTQYIHFSPVVLGNIFLQIYSDSGAATGDPAFLSGDVPSGTRELSVARIYFIRVWATTSAANGAYRIAYTAASSAAPDVIIPASSAGSSGASSSGSVVSAPDVSSASSTVSSSSSPNSSSNVTNASSVMSASSAFSSRASSTSSDPFASHIMVPIAAGYFIMSGAGVTLTKGFYMGKYEVTQELYQAVMGSNPSSFTTGVTAGEVQEKRPVERVSWYDAIVFCNKLSMLEGLSPVYRISGSTNPANWGVVPTGVWNSVTGQYDIDAAAWDAATVNWAANGYRLPTEAEWEYACRAGTTTTYNLGNSWDDAWGWYAGNSDAKTHEVGKKTPNAWGLYDMHGNVREWVWDWYGSLESGLVNDPTGSASGSDRVARGGDLHNSTTITASWFRNFNSFPYLRNSAIGFRLARNTSNDIGVTSHIMVTIAAGTFSMGSPDTEVNRRDDERQHPVTLTRGFYMGKYEVTQELYQAVMGSNPSTFKTDVTSGEMQERRPVEQVSWYNAIVFCNKLSMMERFTPVYTISGSTDPSTWGSVPTSSNSTWNGITVNWNANGYRLPTEAEWEYACRAGTTTAYHTGAGISDSTGWYSSNSGSKTHEVGKKTTNAWGLYDMHGNVMEWCWDWYGSGYLAAPDAGTDPKGSASGTHRVLRSGNWGGVSMHVRSAYRVFWGNEPTSGYEPSSKNNGVGFRLARNN